MNTCEMCAYYKFDDDWECYVCLVNLDEDEMMRFLSGRKFECPYFKADDEYAIVRRQN
ncbi:MAG: DUF6472 family protein [Clostridia bacterium]|nr:DUF6472 family protein [Clostridia bacterium]